MTAEAKKARLLAELREALARLLRVERDDEVKHRAQIEEFAAQIQETE